MAIGTPLDEMLLAFIFVFIAASLQLPVSGQAPCAIPRRTITFQDGYSGFMEDPNPNIRWLLNQGQTPTANTGPIVDRTTGMAQGRYVYAEVTNPLDPDRPQTSRLTSTFYGPPDGPCEINYWIYSFGIDTGLFQAFIAQSNDSVGLQVAVAFRQSRPSWLNTRRIITPNSNFQVQFRYTNTQIPEGDAGDFAVDDFSFSSTCCSDNWFQCGSREWRYFPDFVSWETAQGDCIELGGTLATVSSLQELNCARQLLPCNGTQCPSMFVGLNDRILEGLYTWTGPDGLIEDPESRNWANNQPVPGTQNNCVAWHTVRGLVTTACPDSQPLRLPFICQRNEIRPVQAIQCRGRIWRKHNQASSYSDAQVRCTTAGEQLATILTDDDYQCLHQLSDEFNLRRYTTVSLYLACSNSPSADSTVIWSGSDRPCLNTNQTTNTVCGTWIPGTSPTTGPVALTERNCDSPRPYICQEDLDECALGIHDCPADVLCENNFGSYSCLCNGGFVQNATNGLCDNIDECTTGTHDCVFPFVCMDTFGSFTCSCTQGTRPAGQECEGVNECVEATHDCHANATCNDTAFSFACVCNPGFEGNGVTCNNVDECATSSRACASDRQCVDTVGSFRCICPEGTFENGTNCTVFDECLAGNHDCHINAMCNSTFRNFTCSCLGGFEGDGRNCTDINECITGSMTSSPCSEMRTCFNTIGSFVCLCPNGTRLENDTCLDIDECLNGLHDCNTNASCENTATSFSCICDEGYTGDGRNCQDVDECRYQLDNCSDDKRICANTIGGFVCNCPNGTMLNNISQCEDIDECLNGLHDCDTNASCENTPTSFSCICNKGYTGDGRNCQDVDECRYQLDNCSDDNRICANTIGGFVCNCPNGTMLNNISQCEDIDECATGQHNCSSPGLLCFNIPRTFICQCQTGLFTDTSGECSSLLEIPYPSFNTGSVMRSVYVHAFANNFWTLVAMLEVTNESVIVNATQYTSNNGILSVIIYDTELSANGNLTQTAGLNSSRAIFNTFLEPELSDWISMALSDQSTFLDIGQVISGMLPITIRSHPPLTDDSASPPSAEYRRLDSADGDPWRRITNNMFTVEPGVIYEIRFSILTVSSSSTRQRRQVASEILATPPIPFVSRTAVVSPVPPSVTVPSTATAMQTRTAQPTAGFTTAIVDEAKGDSSSTAVIAGAAAGGVVLLLLLIAIFIACGKRKRNSGKYRPENSQAPFTGYDDLPDISGRPTQQAPQPILQLETRSPEHMFELEEQNSSKDLTTSTFRKGGSQEVTEGHSTYDDVEVSGKHAVYYSHLNGDTGEQVEEGTYSEARETGKAPPNDPVYDVAESSAAITPATKPKGVKNPFSTFANFRKKSSPTLATAPNGASNPMYGESGEPSSKAVANPTNNGVVPTATAKSPPASSPPPVPDKRLDLPRFPGFAAAAAPADSSQAALEAQTSETNVERLYALPFVEPPANPTDMYSRLQGVLYPHLARAHLILSDEIGKGNSGEVHKAVWIKSEDESIPVAVKSLKPGKSEKEKADFLREAVIMGQFNHENIVRLHGVVDAEEPCLIVLELMSIELRKHLYSMNGNNGDTVPDCMRYSIQISSGMAYLASRSFIHRDLAARNVMLSNNNVCKICDFGMSRTVEDDDYYMSGDGLVPVKWTAPESIRYRKYSTASDVWSFGVVLYEIFSSGAKPYFRWSNEKVLLELEDGFRLPQPEKCPDAVYQLQLKCWSENKDERPTFPNILTQLEDIQQAQLMSA